MHTCSSIPLQTVDVFSPVGIEPNVGIEEIKKKEGSNDESQRSFGC